MEAYRPETFVAPSAQAEALGQVLLVFAEIAKYIPLTTILEANGLAHIEPHNWYPMQNALNVFKALHEDPQSPNYDLVRIGMKSLEAFEVPASINSIESALSLPDKIAKTFARNVPEAFGFPVEIVGMGHAVITNNTPVPASGVYGFIWNIINNRKSPDELFLVRMLPVKPGEPGVIEVKWGPVEDGPVE